MLPILLRLLSLPSTASSEAINYSTYTVPQLKALLDEKGIAYTSSDLKADLIALLTGG